MNLCSKNLKNNKTTLGALQWHQYYKQEIHSNGVGAQKMQNCKPFFLSSTMSTPQEESKLHAKPP
jgi:hypothetical protein